MGVETVGDGYDYIRGRYGVEVKVGQHVVIDGTHCVVVEGENDQYLHFTPNGYNRLIAHPTWRVDYHPGVPPVLLEQAASDV